jgi:predicted PurR-regulated permease PerM
VLAQAAPTRHLIQIMTNEAASLQDDTSKKELGVTELNAPAEERLEMSLPRDPKSIFLGGLFFLATLAALYVAGDIILPILIAFLLKLLLQPALGPFERLHVPRTISALLVVFIVSTGIVGFAVMVSGPAMSWVQKIPEGFPRLEKHMKQITQPIAQIERVLKRAERVAQGPADGTPAVKVQGAGLADTLVAGTFNVVVGILTTILLLFFLLAVGDTFLRRIVEVLPRFKDKRQAVDIVQQIEHDISAYLITISTINLMVGIATGAAMHFYGLGDAILWGAAAFLLNFVPILGPMVGVGMFGLVGLLSFDSLGLALIPAGIYLIIHVIEGEFITPLILAKRLTLNPVIIILSLIFWYWMWGVPGAILAVPILAIVKIICDRIKALMAVGHFLEG